MTSYPGALRNYAISVLVQLPQIFSYSAFEFLRNSALHFRMHPSVLEPLGQVASRLVRVLNHGNTKDSGYL